MENSLEQSFRLHRKNKFASLLSFFFGRGNKRSGRKLAGQFAFCGFLIEIHYCVFFRRKRRIVFSYFVRKLFDVDFAYRNAVTERLAFLKNRSALCNDIVSCKNHIGRGLSLSGVRIYITAIEPSRCGLNQKTSVTALAYHFVACRQIENYSGALCDEFARRRICHPHILAYFHAERIIAVISICKYDLTERTASAGNGYLRENYSLSRSEISSLVKFRIVGYIGLGYDAEYFAFVNYYSTVENLTVFYNRRTDCKYHI